ncbi:S24 family peptidase [Helicobacter bizzozeronii]|uniref:S24 family peptidase n=1 Tax=Helicobacter bizzozeronii TaxID=56877 RepID=UPI001315A544|nr:S24 family peptidase [Helicobacter bizzozeronii]
MKTFFRVDSLDKVGVALGFARGSSAAWSTKQRFSNTALLKYYELRAKGVPPPPIKEENYADFKQLGREMKEFFRVGSLRAVAQELGLLPSTASVWHKAKQFPDDVVARFEQMRAEKQAQMPTQQGLFGSLQGDSTPHPAPSRGDWGRGNNPQKAQEQIKQVAELLHATRRAHGFRNWVEMGAVMGVPAGTLRSYSSGKSPGVPSRAFLAKLAKLADVSALIGEVQGVQKWERKKEYGDVLVSVYDNLGTLAKQNEVKTPMVSFGLRGCYPKNALEFLGVKQEEIRLARLKNDAMSPLLEAGDYVLVEDCLELRSGDIIVFEYAGEVFIKRIEKNPITGGIKFFAANREVADFELESGLDEKFKMMGVVRGKFKVF